MSKKLKKFLYPDWRKMTLFFLVILFFTFLWMQVLINSLPIMIIGTQEFEKTFCDIQLTSSNCSFTSSQIYQKEAILNQTVDQLNAKYNQFSKLNTNFDLANKLIPATALSCMLDKDVVSLIDGNSQTQNLNVLGMTATCESTGFASLAINMVIVYLVICAVFWLYDKKK